jgi:hypothetical protein
MRKGLAITLGVVALVLVVSPGFAVAPIISCVPDIVVSDVEDNTMTDDNNLFVFSDALDLDEYVQDADTSVSSLKWSFIQSAGPTIEINGIGENTSGNIREPGAFDIRLGNPTASIRNVTYSPTANPLPHATPATAPEDSTIELIVSDSTNTGSQTVIITSIDDNASPFNDGVADALVPQSQASFTFAASQEGWTWYFVTGVTAPTETYNSTDGQLEMTEAAGGTGLVFGGWESPKDPAVIGHPKLGCVLRGRFHMSSSGDGATVPGFRLRAVTTHVTLSGSDYIPDFLNPDTNSDLTAEYFTPDIAYVDGREPGTAGKLYEILSYPEQVESLLQDTLITYVTCDLLDLDKAFSDDSGTLIIEQVDVDGMDRPAAGAGTAVAALSFAGNFAGWTTSDVVIGTGGSYGTWTQSPPSTELGVTIASTNSLFDMSAVSAATPLDVGTYYRAIFTVAASTTGSNAAPTLRAGFVSSQFSYSVSKNLPGGGLLTALTSTPYEYEVWTQAPPVAAGETQTEGISMRFETWLTANPTGFPFDLTVAGTLTCSDVAVEQFPAPAEAPP